MREVNITITYFMKISEVVFLLFLAITMTLNTITFNKGIVVDYEINYLLGACIVLAWYHLLHNNFLSNLRLKLRSDNVYCDPFWTFINFMICKFGPGNKKNGC